MANTAEEFDYVVKTCRDLYNNKLKDYGASWRIMRPQSITDQIFIKVNRIRSIEISGEAKIDEDIRGEFIAIVNYGIIGQIQLELGFADTDDITPDKAIELYDKIMGETRSLMLDKNHDYGEAWRSMRISSFTDIILTKIYRTKQIESNDGKTIISEGVDANYKDMVNYAIFALIKLEYE